MAIRKWGPLFALLAIAGAGVTGLVIQNPKPYDQAQPTKTESRNSPTPKAVAETATDQSDKKGEKIKAWYEPFFEKPTDTLMVLFNGFLALFTCLLYVATKGLFTETKGLRIAAEDPGMLEINRRMQEIMADQTKIMKQQAAITHMTQRAHVSFHNFQHGFRYNRDGGPDAMRFAVRVLIQAQWINSGLSRATDCINWVNIVVLPGDATDLPADFAFPGPQSAPIKFSIDPKQVIDGAGEWYEIEDLEAVMNDKATAYFYGGIEYRDIFQPETLRQTTFCYRLRVFSDPRKPPADPSFVQFRMFGTGRFDKST